MPISNPVLKLVHVRTAALVYNMGYAFHRSTFLLSLPQNTIINFPTVNENWSFIQFVCQTPQSAE